MKYRRSYAVPVALCLGLGVLLSGCVSPAPSAFTSVPTQTQSYATTGVVESIDIARQASNGVGGALVGGAVGGLLGNQIGGGTGRTAATVAGAVGGAVVGNQVEKNRNIREAYTIRIRMDDGTVQALTQSDDANLRIGDRVRIEGGRVSRY